MSLRRSRDRGRRKLAGRRAGHSHRNFSIAIVKDANEALQGLSRAAGTFAYMAPEQAIGYAQPASDIYSAWPASRSKCLRAVRCKDLLPSASLDLPNPVRILLRGLPIPLSETSVEMIALAQEYDPKRRPNVAGVFASPIVADLESFSGAQHPS